MSTKSSDLLKKKAMSMQEGLAVLESEIRPMVHLNTKMLPAIKKWEVGKKYAIILSVREQSLRERPDKSLEATFEVLSAKPYEEAYKE